MGGGGFGRGGRGRGPTDEEREAERKRKMEECKWKIKGLQGAYWGRIKLVCMELSVLAHFLTLLLRVFREEKIGGWTNARRP